MTVEYLELRPKEFLERLKKVPVAYLPLGTLEWHGPHLPLGSDALQSVLFFKQLAAKAGGIVVPPLFLGPDRRKVKDGHEYFGMDIFGFSEEHPVQLEGSAYWADDSLFEHMIIRVLKNLKRAGFFLVVAHGHGPSTHYIKDNADMLESETEIKLLTCWRNDETDGKGFMVDHAGVNETSIMLSLKSDLVDLNEIDTGRVRGTFGGDPKTESYRSLGEEITVMHLNRMAKLIRKELNRQDLIQASR